MKLLFAANTNADPNQGASGCDLATIAALRGKGCTVDTIWADDMPRRIQHGNLHQLWELPTRFANAVSQRCLTTSYDVIQVNQPHAYLAAREHQQLSRPGIFVNRSHGWEPHVHEAMDRLPSHTDRSAIRDLCSKAMWSLIRSHNSKVLQYSDGIVLCSVDDRDFIIRNSEINPHKLLALAPGIAPDFLVPIAPLEGRSRKLLYVGQFTAHKAPLIVAEIANEAMLSCPDVTLTWVCSKSDHQKVYAALKPAIHSRVSVLPWMPREQLRGVYDEHGILLFPSRFEGFSLTFLEAMARGLCVLATNIDGMRQTISHGSTGFLFGIDSVSDFVQQLLILLRDPDQSAQIGRKARTVAETFTWERTASELLQFYEVLHSAKKNGRFAMSQIR